MAVLLMPKNQKDQIILRLFLLLFWLNFHSRFVLGNISTDPNNIHFYLFPRENDVSYREEIIFGNESSIVSFKPNVLTVFIAHGFVSSPETQGPEAVRNAYILTTLGGNYISVDWSSLAGNYALIVDSPILYGIAVSNVPTVGKSISKLIQWLYSKGLVDPNKVHLIGYSLGAHVMGEAGADVQRGLGGAGKVGRLSGMDPAGPLFFPPIEPRNIHRGDAHFVDIIHTNKGLAGTTTQDGHVDFFPNGGTVQPGCTPANASCSHVYSMLLYAASISQNFTGCQCPQPYLVDTCSGVVSSNCKNPTPVGFYCPTTARGVYNVRTPPLGPRNATTVSVDEE